MIGAFETHVNADLSGDLYTITAMMTEGPG